MVVVTDEYVAFRTPPPSLSFNPALPCPLLPHMYAGTPLHHDYTTENVELVSEQVEGDVTVQGRGSGEPRHGSPLSLP